MTSEDVRADCQQVTLVRAPPMSKDVKAAAVEICKEMSWNSCIRFKPERVNLDNARVKNLVDEYKLKDKVFFTKYSDQENKSDLSERVNQDIRRSPAFSTLAKAQVTSDGYYLLDTINPLRIVALGPKS